MNKFKKMIAVILTLVLCFSISDSFCASEVNDKLRYGEREEWTTVQTYWYTTTVQPSGQLPGGTKLETPGGLFVNMSSGTLSYIDVSVPWGKVSIGVNLGVVSNSSSVGGFYLAFPNTTDYFIVKIEKEYKIEYKKVDMYKYNEYVGTYYTTTYTLYRQNAYLEAVE